MCFPLVSVSHVPRTSSAAAARHPPTRPGAAARRAPRQRLQRRLPVTAGTGPARRQVERPADRQPRERPPALRPAARPDRRHQREDARPDPAQPRTRRPGHPSPGSGPDGQLPAHPAGTHAARTDGRRPGLGRAAHQRGRAGPPGRRRPARPATAVTWHIPGMLILVYPASVPASGHAGSPQGNCLSPMFGFPAP